MQKFAKGRTNNHATWMMVDATDFATPESAVSAATTIKIYGKLRGGTGTNFVSSGTGSLTNDITHVGASVTGLYTIALVKADLSDASAAWYDQYIIALSATGCARQALVIDGGIDESTILAMSAMLSDTHSAAILGASHASDAYSAALIIQSRLSDLDSRLASDTSDIYSGIVALSGLVSDAHSAAGVGNSRILLVQSRLSDLDSRLSSDISDIRSAISDAHSDLKSALGDLSVTITASDISDIASAVVAALPITSVVSDIYSLLSDLNSNFNSRIPLEPAGRSQLIITQSMASDAASAAVQANSRVLLVQSRLSDLDSRLASDTSDILSQLTVVQSMASDAASAAQQGSSRTLLVQSRLSDLDSRLSSDTSDIYSGIVALSGLVSDVQSAIAAGVTIGASSLSDIRSAITAAEFDASDISDIASAVWARAGSDPAAVIGVTAGMGAKLDWLAAMSRNKLTQTATEQTLLADNGTTVVASAVVSDDGTTATRGEFA